MQQPVLSLETRLHEGAKGEDGELLYINHTHHSYDNFTVPHLPKQSPSFRLNTPVYHSSLLEQEEKYCFKNRAAVRLSRIRRGEVGLSGKGLRREMASPESDDMFHRRDTCPGGHLSRLRLAQDDLSGRAMPPPGPRVAMIGRLPPPRAVHAVIESSPHTRQPLLL
jgi:hypothetical protein